MMMMMRMSWLLIMMMIMSLIFIIISSSMLVYAQDQEPTDQASRVPRPPRLPPTGINRPRPWTQPVPGPNEGLPGE